MFVKVLSPAKVVEGVSAKTGNPYRIVSQSAILIVNPDDPYSGIRFKLGIEHESVQHPLGDYRLTPEAFSVEKGRLGFAYEMELEPMDVDASGRFTGKPKAAETKAA